MTPIHPFTATLIEKRLLASNISLFTFQTADLPLVFIPGQYIILDVPGSPHPVKRLYSIASSNSTASCFDLLIKNVPGGKASAYVNSLVFGQTASFTGPAGQFFYQKTEKPKVFMTTGTGFAPIRSFLLSLLEDDGAKKTLLWGVPSLEDIYLFSELLLVKKKLPSLTFYYCLSQEQSLKRIPAQFRNYFRLGHIDAAWDELKKEKNNDVEYYFSGSREIVESLRLLFLSKGVDTSSLFFEKY